MTHLLKTFCFTAIFLIAPLYTHAVEMSGASEPSPASETAPENLDEPIKRGINAICTRQAFCADEGVHNLLCYNVFMRAALAKKIKITDQEAKACETALKAASCESLNRDIPKDCAFIKKIGK